MRINSKPPANPFLMPQCGLHILPASSPAEKTSAGANAHRIGFQVGFFCKNFTWRNGMLHLKGVRIFKRSQTPYGKKHPPCVGIRWKRKELPPSSPTKKRAGETPRESRPKGASFAENSDALQMEYLVFAHLNPDVSGIFRPFQNGVPTAPGVVGMPDILPVFAVRRQGHPEP